VRMRNALRYGLSVLLALGLASASARGDVVRKTLLSTDGTLYTASTGTASELNVVGNGLTADDYTVTFSSVAQDGIQSGGPIPGVSNSSPKTSLDLTFDEPTGTVVVLWREENFVLNQIRLAIGRAGNWTVADLLPNVGFPHAYSPQMLLTHQTVHSLDANGGDVYTNRSVLSVIWWEEAHFAQARYASLFLDESIDPAGIEVYDLPELVGDVGPTSLDGVPRGAYAFPSLQAEGPDGAILASFADLASGKDYVVRLTYPADVGLPSADNKTWLRRRIPVVGIASSGPIAAISAFSADSITVHTVIGSSYKPTLYWTDGIALHYVRFDGAAWSSVRTIALSTDLTYDQAVALVVAMASRN
jgi:hypothetical protein